MGGGGIHDLPGAGPEGGLAGGELYGGEAQPRPLVLSSNVRHPLAAEREGSEIKCLVADQVHGNVNLHQPGH